MVNIYHTRNYHYFFRVIKSFSEYFKLYEEHLKMLHAYFILIKIPNIFCAVLVHNKNKTVFFIFEYKCKEQKYFLYLMKLPTCNEILS